MNSFAKEISLRGKSGSQPAYSPRLTGVTTTIEPHGPSGVITAVAIPHKAKPPALSVTTAGPPESPRQTRAPGALATASRGLANAIAVFRTVVLKVPAA